MTYRISPVRASATFALRQAVLRPHQAVEEMALPDDDGPSTTTFAALDEQNEVVAAARVAPAQAPVVIGSVGAPDGGCWQLRGMATRPDLRNRGLGGAVLGAAIDHVAAHGGGLLWCNARMTARTLYRRAGFTEHGEPWEEPDIGPHVVMGLVVPDAPGDPNR